MPKPPKDITLSFVGGIDNLSKEYELKKGFVRQALNVDIDTVGNVSRREGYTKRISLTNAHSGFSTSNLFLFVDSSGLNVFYPDSYTKEVIDSSINPLLPMAYCKVKTFVYYSNGENSGKVSPEGEVTPWRVSNPSSQPLLSASVGGTLVEGKYQLVVTNVDSSGQESGTTLAQMIDVPEGGYITLSNIPQDNNVSKVRVYLSTPNGDKLYHVIDILFGITTYNIYSQIRGKALNTQFLEEMPPGNILGYYRGRLYSINDNVIRYSDPITYGRYTPLENYFPPFPEDITIFLPVTNGIFVVADKTYFIEGTDPSNMNIRVVSKYCAVKRTGLLVSSSVFNFEELNEPIAYWFSEKGAMLGLPSGQILPVTEKKIDPGKYGEGASVLREYQGIRSLITSFRNPQNAGGFKVTDSAVAEVRRNGIIIG